MATDFAAKIAVISAFWGNYGHTLDAHAQAANLNLWFWSIAIVSHHQS